ncbi:MAG: hypothetical protein ABSF38_06295 [Verrucomicrobiota bacterium]|jgi:hypothetical protein
MKDFDLESELKALRVPERGQEFWDAFPQRVLAQLRSAPAPQPVRRMAPPRLAWAAGLALACLAAAFCLWQSRTERAVCYAFLRDERELRRTIQHFPDHVRALMQDEHGLHRLIEDPP